MKRILIMLTAAVMLLSFAACGGGEKALEGTLEELMQGVYDGCGKDELPVVENTEITAENAEYYFGTADVAYKEALASEALISAIPHSICLLRLVDAGEAAAVKEKIKANANPNKWICVGVEDKDVIVDSIGDVVILIMADDAQAYDKSFQALAE